MMKNDMEQFMPIVGFKSLKWPLTNAMKSILNRFAQSNDLFVSAINASIWQDNVHADTTQFIQVTFFEDEEYVNSFSYQFIYPMIVESVDKFDAVQLNFLDSSYYACSLKDYFEMCSRPMSFFTRTSDYLQSGKILKTIDNADNALIELDMLSAVN